MVGRPRLVLILEVGKHSIVIQIIFNNISLHVINMELDEMRQGYLD